MCVATSPKGEAWFGLLGFPSAPQGLECGSERDGRSEPGRCRRARDVARNRAESRRANHRFSRPQRTVRRARRAGRRKWRQSAFAREDRAVCFSRALSLPAAAAVAAATTVATGIDPAPAAADSAAAHIARVDLTGIGLPAGRIGAVSAETGRRRGIAERRPLAAEELVTEPGAAEANEQAAAETAAAPAIGSGCVTRP